MPKKTKTPVFEDAIDRLEVIIESMETGDTPLDELIAKFEEGSTLLKACYEKLRTAELKIEKLNLEIGKLEPFKVQEIND